MLTFDTISDARNALMEFRFTKLDQLPTDRVKAQLKDFVASPSPVDQIVGAMELLYANSEHLDNDGRQLVGALAAFATTNAWHGLQQDERGSKIVLAMLRDSGEKPIPGVKFPKAEGDPAPNASYVDRPVADADMTPNPNAPASEA